MKGNINRELDSAFIKIPSLWPRFPLLPVTRYENGKKEYGVIHCKSDTSVKIINMFLAPHDFETFQELEGIDYQSIDELLDDGWMVD